MRPLTYLLAVYEKFGLATMPVEPWNLFIKAVASAFLVYWLHLGHGLNDWLGSEGFHLVTPASAIFVPLPFPFPQFLWFITFTGAFLMFFQRTVTWGCLLAGGCFFYATMCDWTSIGALNMHFLYAFAVILWSTGLKSFRSAWMAAWPAYLIRVYLVVVYFGSGWRKVIYGNWLNDPHVLLHCLSGYYVTDVVRWLYPVTPPLIWTLIQYFTLTFELGAPLLLLYSPFRKWGVFIGCLLHIGIAIFMRDIFYFSFQMITFYIPVLIPISYSLATSAKDHQSEI